MTVRWPPFQVVPFGTDLMVRCAECGDVQQIDTRWGLHGEGAASVARQTGREHQRWTHPTEEEQMLDHLREYEFGGEMDKFCARCGVEGHKGRDCPVVTPGLLKSNSKGDRQ